ncbi:sulfatase [Bacillus sp. FJAT-28004]|uniref:sulfatase family protein n=1 Tax=Bacillus sp. FJAT-28004 TaxID=1679165 RepID=UPI0006B5F376|nr:sulfatase [Bacillus sp. FJAT-28004]
MKILFLDLDSLNPDHLGCYGYHRNTSPEIDRIAAEGVRFTNYYTSDAPCAPSRTALMTGKFGIVNGLVGHGGTAGDLKLEGADRQLMGELSRAGSLPAYLQMFGGLKTALISPFAYRHSTFSFYAGFNEVYDTGGFGMESADQVTPVALDWINRNAASEDDWFLYINFWDPHTPYRAPESFGNPFENEPIAEWLTEEVLERHRLKVGPHSVNELAMDPRTKSYTNQSNPLFPRDPGEIKDMADLRKMMDGFDTGIRYMDEHIGILFDRLEQLDVMEELIIIISADHGENMGHLGIYGEHSTANHGTCHLPMIIRWPGMKRGWVDEGLHYHLDLAPTIAEMLNMPAMPQWSGTSYAKALKEGADCGRDYLVVSQCAHVAQRGVRFGDWMYIRSYHDGYHLFDKEMLYNLREDPYEQHNVAEQNIDVCREAVYYLTEWHDEMMLQSNDDVDPLWTVIKEGGPAHAKGYLKSYVHRLEETGRGQHVAELKRKHPREFPEEYAATRQSIEQTIMMRMFTRIVQKS